MATDPTKPNILYVDDEQDNLAVFLVAFRRHYNIFLAESAQRGFEILAQEKIHVVVTDQRMPNMTGVEFLSQIPEEPFITRIILTAYTEAQAIIDAVNKGHIFRYINKPWKLDDLKQTLDNAVAHQKLNETNKQLLSELQLSNEKLAVANGELKEKNRQLFALDKAKSEFLNIISHEIKTPLNGIIGLTRLLSAQVEGEQYRKFFDALKTSVDRLDEFSQNAIFLTELETQSYQPKPQTSRFDEIVEAARHVLRHKIRDKQVEIRYIAPPELKFHTDPSLLRKSIIVLLDNAIRFSPEACAVELNASYEQGRARVSITDRGPGFSAQAIERLYKYFGIGETHYDQHLGLGLSIVKMVMERFGGQVSVHNNAQGATVALDFPA